MPKDLRTDLLTVLAVLVIGILVGMRFQLVYGPDTSRDLPKCEEDEYLYPSDYKGPGNNQAGDYICVHTDVIAIDWLEH